MKTISKVFNSALLGISMTYTCIALADAPTWTPFRTPIKCKTIEVELVTLCKPVREADAPAECKLQTLEFKQPKKSRIVLFNPVPSPGINEESILGRPAFNWFCSRSGKRDTEILTLKIGNWFNARDEGLIMFNDQGRRLTKKETSQVTRTQAWQEASWNWDINATAHGRVAEPKFE